MVGSDDITLELDGHEGRFSNPGKVFFPARGYTKLDLCRNYLDVADAVLRGLLDSPRPSSASRTASATAPGA